jgi:hypothetical protein
MRQACILNNILGVDGIVGEPHRQGIRIIEVRQHDVRASRIGAGDDSMRFAPFSLQDTTELLLLAMVGPGCAVTAAVESWASLFIAKWKWRFCKLACKRAYEYRRRKEIQRGRPWLEYLFRFAGCGLRNAD